MRQWQKTPPIPVILDEIGGKCCNRLAPLSFPLENSTSLPPYLLSTLSLPTTFPFPLFLLPPLFSSTSWPRCHHSFPLLPSPLLFRPSSLFTYLYLPTFIRFFSHPPSPVSSLLLSLLCYSLSLLTSACPSSPLDFVPSPLLVACKPDSPPHLLSDPYLSSSLRSPFASGDRWVILSF